MRSHIAKTVLTLLAIGAFAFICVPSVRADSITFDLTSNNLGISGSVGTVTIKDTGVNQVTVLISMNPGFSLKLPGGDVGLGAPSGLNAGSVSGVTAFSGASIFSGLSFKHFFNGKNISEFGVFTVDYANVEGAPHGVVSADSMKFVLTGTGLTASQFTGAAIHFCTASGTGCGPQTGFATSGQPVSTVPEPSTLSLLSAGLIGLAGIVRGRIRG